MYSTGNIVNNIVITLYDANHIKQSIKTREGRKIVEAKNGNKEQMQ